MQNLDLAPVWAFDDQVPVDLSLRWAAADSDAVLLGDFTRSLAIDGGIVLLLGSLAALATGIGRPEMSITCAAVAAVALVFGWSSHRKAKRRLGGFSVREIDFVLDHRTEVSFNDWALLPAESIPPEVRGARQAARLCRQLMNAQAWSSEHLATQRIRVNPAEESRHIQLAAREIYDRRCIIESETSRFDGALTAELQRAREAWNEQLQESLGALNDRVVAFVEYVEEMLEVAMVIDQRQAADRLTTDLVERAPMMAVGSVRHEMASADLRRLKDELDQLRQQLHSETSP